MTMDFYCMFFGVLLSLFPLESLFAFFRAFSFPSHRRLNYQYWQPVPTRLHCILQCRPDLRREITIISVLATMKSCSSISDICIKCTKNTKKNKLKGHLGKGRHGRVYTHEYLGQSLSATTNICYPSHIASPAKPNATFHCHGANLPPFLLAPVCCSFDHSGYHRRSVRKVEVMASNVVAFIDSFL